MPVPSEPYFTVETIGANQVVTATDKGLVKWDGTLLTMGDMGKQADQRNMPQQAGPLGMALGNGMIQMYGYAGLNQQALQQQALAQAQAGRALVDALQAQQQQGIGGGKIVLRGLGGLAIPTLAPKLEPDIPIQQPTNKRRIKLRD